MLPEIPDPEPEPEFQLTPIGMEPGEAQAAPAREPFWGYLDLAMFIGLGVAFFVVLCAPIILIFKPQAGKSSFVLVALAVQVALYGSIYLSLLLVFTRYHKPVFRSLGWRRVPFNLGWSVLWGVSLTAVVAGVIYLSHAPQVPSPVEGLVTSRAALIGVAVLAALAAPIFEEALFRGFLQPLLSRTLGVVAGILITAVLFGALHVPEYSFAWQYGLAITVVGAAFGYARCKTNSLIPSTVMHASFNTISVIGLIYTKFPSLK
jgi:hypothetical protein